MKSSWNFVTSVYDRPIPKTFLLKSDSAAACGVASSKMEPDSLVGPCGQFALTVERRRERLGEIQEWREAVANALWHMGRLAQNVVALRASIVEAVTANRQCMHADKKRARDEQGELRTARVWAGRDRLAMKRSADGVEGDRTAQRKPERDEERMRRKGQEQRMGWQRMRNAGIHE
eukprot:5145672-Pleurochrysis_carterae.AAC.3